jgi:hypothetical protein
MAVEIVILSGSRRNERIVLDNQVFRAGSDPNCEVFFDPQREPAIRGRSAKFCLQDGGWYVHGAGGEMYVNKRRMTGATHIRSGDKIRMSDSGPEFSFQVVAAAKPSPASVPGLEVISPLPLGEGQGVRAAQGSANVGAASPAADGLSLATASPGPASPQAAAVEVSAAKTRDRQPIIWFAGGLAATLVALLVFRMVIIVPTPPLPPVPPTIAVNDHRISVTRGTTAVNSGTYGNEGGGTLTITASAGTVKQDDTKHTWRWSCVPASAGTETVTISATNSGGSATAEFALVVKAREPSPTIGVKNDKVEVNQGTPAENSGTYDNEAAGVVTITASVGKVTQDADTRAWHWSYTPSGNPPPQTVTITAKNQEGASGSAIFELVVSTRKSLHESVFLIVVERAGRYWQFATCVAVADDTLLTTANEAAILAKWQQSKKFKIWVTRPTGNFDFKKEVEDIRVLAPFAVLPEESDDRLFVNVGLLTVQGTLPKADVASPKDFGEIREGSRVSCIGFSVEGKMTPDEKIEPFLTAGKVFVIEVGRELPGQPNLLQMQAEMPKNAFGSPVVNKDGKILGLYSDAIPDSKGVKNLHHVTIVDPESIRLWLQDRGKAKIWVPASPSSTPGQQQKPKQP